MLLQSLAQAYNYNYTVPASSGSKAGNSAFIIAGVVLVAAFVVFAIVTLWRIFVKAGRPGWSAIIPIYNNWVLAEIAGKPGWWVLLAFIPVVGWLIYTVLYVIICIGVAKKFGKSPWFALLLLIPPLQLVGLPILAYGKARYEGADDSAPSAPAKPAPAAASNPPASPAPHRRSPTKLIQ
jgi:Family of unknown function (DUF5684)